MKKLYYFLPLLLAFLIVACGDKKEDTPEGDNGTTTEETAPEGAGDKDAVTESKVTVKSESKNVDIPDLDVKHAYVIKNSPSNYQLLMINYDKANDSAYKTDMEEGQVKVNILMSDNKGQKPIEAGQKIPYATVESGPSLAISVYTVEGWVTFNMNDEFENYLEITYLSDTEMRGKFHIQDKNSLLEGTFVADID
jgi:hypothetical protein